MIEWCMLCHKYVDYHPVDPYTRCGVTLAKTSLWFCAECGNVIYKKRCLTEEESRRIEENAALLDGFD